MNQLKFKMGYMVKRPEVLKAYQEIKRNESKGIDFLREFQNRQLQKMVRFAVENVPYYSNLFSSLDMTWKDVTTVKDLEKIPILTKDEMKKSPESFIPKNQNTSYVNGSTGGSTGVPLKYRMSNEDYARGVALLLRGFGFAGYHLGDKMSIIAGSSLVSTSKSLKSRIQDYMLNFYRHSSYGMDENDLQMYFLQIKKNKPLFLRGYASSIYLFAKYVEENQLSLDHQIRAIFTTSEMLFPQQRDLIERVFKTKVFNNYGLNDGGVSAFECPEHNGMHIDFERSVLEVVDEQGRQVTGKTGKILATSLFNYATPFIRYDTGDLGSITDEACPCGCPRPLLKNLSGRVTDYLKLNGKVIGSPVLTVLMGKVNAEFYQIRQKTHNEIDVNILKGRNYSSEDEHFIRQSFTNHVGDIKITFNYLTPSSINLEKKHKFIINEVCK